MSVLFAVEDSVVAIIGAASAAAGGGIAWLVKIIVTGRKTTLVEYQRLVDRLQKNIDRCQSQVDSQQSVINEMVQLHAECRAETQEQYGMLAMQHGILQRQREALVKAGIAAEEVPDLPERPRRARDDRVEYLRRETQHNTDIAKAAKRDSPGAADRGQPDQPGLPR